MSSISLDQDAPFAATSSTPSKSPVSVSTVAIWAVAFYAGAQVIADIASVKIGVVWGQAMDMGTFIYPITFTLRDIVHRTLGVRAARTLIVACAATNAFMALYLQWASNAQPSSSYGLNAEFAAILGPLWRITVASIVAELVSELLDTEVYQRVRQRFGARHVWARVVASNAVSVPIDSAIFCVLAFAALPGLTDNALTLPASAVWQIFLANVWVKMLVGLVSTPLIYLGQRAQPESDPV